MKHTSEGFTLIEMMIVIAIIGILAAVTVPHYQSLMDHYRLESDSNQVLVRLRQAKQMSMDERKNIGVVLNTNQVQLVSVDPATGQLTTLEGAYTFDKRISFNSDPAYSQNLYSNGSEYFLYFDYRGFLQTNPAGSSAAVALKSNQTAQQVIVKLEAGTANLLVIWP